MDTYGHIKTHMDTLIDIHRHRLKHTWTHMDT